MKWFLFFLMISFTALAQKKIEGVVVDKETGKPIPFASLAIVGTTTGTSSNLNGEFSLTLADSFSIKITCVGYESLVINSADEMKLIQLKPIATQLNAIVISNKPVNPDKIVRKAFARIQDNYDTESFLQKFFYRHYSLTNSVYEKLIEASVDVWKHEGYHAKRNHFGEKEEVRITQLRRSLDITGMVRGQKPLWLDNILQTDIACYQAVTKNAPLKIFDEASNLLTDFARYTFTFDGFTTYDGQEVYKINYNHKKDSVLTTSGYQAVPQASGSLFITTDDYAFVKTEDLRFDDVTTIHSSALYRKYGDKYYPYHLMREGENRLTNNQNVNSFHIELMSIEIRHGEKEQFKGKEPGREELLMFPYDSSFWSANPILKTTPLEEEIIHDLGGGISLNKQFYLYRQYELNITDGGKSGEEKFNWLKEDSKGKRILYVCFWDSGFKSYLFELEYMKQLNLSYRNHIVFVMISLENDHAKWQQELSQYNFFSDAIINYRIGEDSELAKEFNVKGGPVYTLISKNGEVILNAKHPNDPLLKDDLRKLIVQGQ